MNVFGIILILGLIVFATYECYSLVRDIIKRKKAKSEHKEDSE